MVHPRSHTMKSMKEILDKSRYWLRISENFFYEHMFHRRSVLESLTCAAAYRSNYSYIHYISLFVWDHIFPWGKANTF